MEILTRTRLVWMSFAVTAASAWRNHSGPVNVWGTSYALISQVRNLDRNGSSGFLLFTDQYMDHWSLSKWKQMEYSYFFYFGFEIGWIYLIVELDKCFMDSGIYRATSHLNYLWIVNWSMDSVNIQLTYPWTVNSTICVQLDESV